METVRLRLDLAYDGTEFAGWGVQPDLRTVQGVLEEALAILLQHPLRSVRLVVAGRTDAGVHATGQVAHIDISEARWRTLRSARRGGTAEQAFARRLNGIVGGRTADLVVKRVSIAAPGFDARFSPLWRRYEYRVADAVSLRDPRRRGHTLWHAGELNVAVMDAAAQQLVGLHDFAAFCKPRERATTVRTLLHYRWVRDELGVLVADVRADAFCHSMVRSLVGGVLAVGLGDLTQHELESILRNAVKANAFPVVVGKGLTLAEVGYPADEQLQARATLTRARRELAARELSPPD